MELLHFNTTSSVTFVSAAPSFVPEQVPVQHFVEEDEVSIILTRYHIIQCLSELGYSFEDGENVAAFLESKIELLPIIKSAHDFVSRYFEQFKLKLDVIIDAEEGSEVLNILVLNNLPVTEAFEKETRLFEEWFLPYFSEFKGILNIREEYSDAI